MAFGKPKAPKEPKAPKAKKPKKEKKKLKKGQEAPPEEEVLEGEEAPKKKKPLILMLIPAVVIVAAAVIVFMFVIRPRLFGDSDPDASVSVEPDPPVLPTELPVGDNAVPGMVLGSDEYQAKAVLAKTITYSYTDLADAGKVAETYVEQLSTAEDRFYVVNEEYVRQTEEPVFTTAEGMVLMARNLPKPEPEAAATPEPAETGDPDASAAPEGGEAAESVPPVEEAPDLMLTVRITWSPGLCVVTADEEEGKVTSPPRENTAAPVRGVTQHGAQKLLEEMNPAQLELPGETMDNYEVMPMDGTEMVDGQACIRLYVYNDNNQLNANEIMGSFLMSIDGQHLYKVDPVTSEIRELDYTP